MRAFFIPIEYLVMLIIMVMSVIVFVVVMVLMPVDMATLHKGEVGINCDKFNKHRCCFLWTPTF